MQAAFTLGMVGVTSIAFAKPVTMYFSGGLNYNTNNGINPTIQSQTVFAGSGITYDTPSTVIFADNYVYSYYPAGKSETFNLPISYTILLEEGSHLFASAPTSPYINIQVSGSVYGSLGTTTSGTPYNTLNLQLNSVIANNPGVNIDFDSDPVNGSDAILVHAPLGTTTYDLYIDMNNAVPGQTRGYIGSHSAPATPAPSSLFVGLLGSVPGAMLLRRRRLFGETADRQLRPDDFSDGHVLD